MKLIDKDAVLAVIDKFKHEGSIPYDRGLFELVCDIESDINSLEVKEVDLDKELDLVEDKYRGFYSLSRADVIAVAKHFFKLGFRASNPLTWEDIRDIYRITKGMYNENQLWDYPEDFFKEAFKRFKEQKEK